MGKIYQKHLLLIVGGLFVSLLITSCKKDHTPAPTPAPKPIATLGLYELQSTIYRRVFIPISQVGDIKNTYYSVFDTGSSAMTMDADGLIPASMITSTGITITGDSLVVNGITVTKQTATLTYGDATNGTKEYGNLAYAIITIGDVNGSVTTKRIPFFLYYKAVDVKSGTSLGKHENDVFGVGPNTSFSNLAIASPLSYFTTAANVTQGFKLSKFDKTAFSTNGTYVKDLLTIGLVPDDLNSAGFIMHSLVHTSAGYSPNIPATIVYNGKSIQGSLLFDTGTPAFANIEDPNATTDQTTLPANSSVTITTTSGFSYQYTTTSDYNLTQVLNPSYTHDPRTIFSIDFFTDNEFLLDYTNHRIGLKN
ncbi:hypothetical protein [Mucilaginibacter xinganensis]|uniref:Aspartyl protease n=1 Tax=Mucilaginibacter xinganensis TaxID=1234841 RepID=A0A223NRB4_9SPHI|nr:hypothetical protein [Mucilaginibacter xinganensis]ASU32442.1 hypothetical protein MuYL_0539 [Mucilaginibacter xinganensis]